MAGRITYKIEDDETDRAFRSLDQRLQDLEKSTAVGGVLLKDIAFPNGVTVVIAHRLGRANVSVFSACPEDGASGSGRIEVMESDTADVTSPDKRNYVLLRATGWGADIVADVWIM